MRKGKKMKHQFCGKSSPLPDFISAYKKLRLPSFSGVLEVLHDIPGRMRFRIPALKKNLMGAENFKQQLTRLNGIEQVSINLFLGTVLVKYDSKVLNSMLVVSASTHCFDFERQMQQHQSVFGREAKSLRFALDQALLRNTYGIIDLRSAMTLMLAGTLVRGIVRHGGTPFTPLNIIWWLFQSIDR